MDLERVHFILDNKEKSDVFYQERPVWIQGVNNHIAKVGFIDNFEERDERALDEERVGVQVGQQKKKKKKKKTVFPMSEKVDTLRI